MNSGPFHDDLFSSEDPPLGNFSYGVPPPSNIMPPNLDDDWMDGFQKKALITRHVKSCTDFITELLENFNPEELLDTETRAKITTVFDHWKDFMVLYEVLLSETMEITISEEEQRATISCLGSHVFLLLSQLFFILKNGELATAKADLVRQKEIPKEVSDNVPYNQCLFLVRGNFMPAEYRGWFYDTKQAAMVREDEEEEDQDEEEDSDDLDDVELDPNKQLIRLSQRELIHAIASFVQGIKYADYKPFLKVILEALWLRHAQLCMCNWSKSTLDHPEYRERRTLVDEELEQEIETQVINRDYLFLMYFYFSKLISRFFYSDLFYSNNNSAHIDVTPAERQNFMRWVKNDVIPNVGESVVMDTWPKICDFYFEVPGDREWFRFKYPQKPEEVITMLSTLRPQKAEEYIAMEKISTMNIFNGVGDRMESNIFLMYCLGIYFHTKVKPDTFWNELYVVNHEDIKYRFQDLVSPSEISVLNPVGAEGAAKRLPLLLQPFGKYGVWFDKKFIRCKDLLEAIYVWFKIVDTRTNCYLKGVFLRDAILDDIFRPITIYDEMSTNLGGRSIQ